MLKKLWRLLFVKKSKNNVYYIHGNDALPKPLSSDDELQCLIDFEKGSEVARDTLIEHNLRLVIFIAKRYESNPIFMEDLISIGSIGLIKAVNTFKRDKGIKLVTYASRCIENEILMYLRKKNRRKVEVSFDEPLNVDYDGNELLLSDIIGTDKDLIEKEFEKKEQKQQIMKALNTLKGREKLIMQMRYGIQQEELTQKDVALILGISQSYISRLEKKIIKKLQAYVQND